MKVYRPTLATYRLESPIYGEAKGGGQGRLLLGELDIHELTVEDMHDLADADLNNMSMRTMADLLSRNVGQSVALIRCMSVRDMRNAFIELLTSSGILDEDGGEDEDAEDEAEGRPVPLVAGARTIRS